jgi:TolA-binding protein
MVKMHTSLAWMAAWLLVAASAVPASAANKEHQQLMADIRMLQEQAQQLQILLGQLTEALKAVNGRIDDQTTSTRKGLADQKLVIDTLLSDLRVVREKVDDNNVRVGSLSQEVDALRQSVVQIATRPPVAPEPDASTAAADSTQTGQPTTPAVPEVAPPPAAVVVASPQKLWDGAYADYAAGQFDLAVLGFEAYVRSFPKSDRADDAQVYVCGAHLNAGQYEKAVEACDIAIRTYPSGDRIPEALYRKGLALRSLKEIDQAREAFETLLKEYPDSSAAILANQQLQEIKKP